MTAAAWVVAHVRRATETGEAATGHGAGMPVAIYLQGCADKQVHGVLAGELAEHAVGAHRTIAAGEEHIRARGDVVFHAQFGAEAMHALHPTAFNRRDQCGVRVEVQLRQILPFSPRDSP